MKFFQDTKGRWYPVERIKRILPPRQAEGAKPETSRVELDGDDTVEIYPYDLDRIQQGAFQIMPAAAGTYYLYAGDTRDEEVYRVAIIAWALCYDGQVRPVTIDGVNDNFIGNADTVLLPDGRVHVFEQEFANQSRWADWKFKQS
ncbi:hypothetical protein ACFOKF_16355 [Sphingobium rhizovicinum]|uniref:Uncharacterized protein n=1 Tax=Sphingobium rhizovicinum TaxID=432308 RepID=A0ABV7NHU4_9SPHN